MRVRSLFLALFLWVFLAGCKAQGARPDPTQGVFKPPTQGLTETPPSPDFQLAGSAGQERSDRPSPTPVCTDNLLFLEDLTIPDGTVVEPGQRLDKRWQVQNNGTCNWGEGYRVKLIAGPGMGVPVQQALVPARSGTETVIRMVYIAPDNPGNYRSAWQAYKAQGIPFGDPFYIDVIVDDPNLSVEGE